MSALRENRVIWVLAALAILALAYSSSNRFLSITEPPTEIVLSATKEYIDVPGVSTFGISYSSRDYFGGNPNGVRITVTIYAEDGTVLVQKSAGGSGSISGTFWLTEEEISKIAGRRIRLSWTLDYNDSGYVASIRYTESITLFPKTKSFYRQGVDDIIQVQTMKIAGLKGNLLLNDKQYTAFTDADGLLNFKVTMPNTLGTYPATVSATDPWTGALIKRDFNIEVRPVTVVTWQKERIAYTGEEFKIRFDVSDADGNKLEPSFLPTVTAIENMYETPVTVTYISTALYEATVHPTTPGTMKITATTQAYGYEPSTETVSVDVVKSVAKISHNIKIEELLGAKTYTISVSDPRGTPIDAVVTVTVDEPLGARAVLTASKVASGKYAVAYRVEQTGVYYWTIDVVPASAVEPVTEKLTMNAIANKNPVSEIGGGILQSPVFSFSVIGLAVTVFVAVWRFRRMQQE